MSPISALNETIRLTAGIFVRVCVSRLGARHTSHARSQAGEAQYLITIAMTMQHHKNYSALSHSIKWFSKFLRAENLFAT